VSFVYERITWEDIVTGTVAFDSWRTSRRAG
jgi:hypothetical protein